MSEPHELAGAVRRLPVQERSAVRLQRMLDAAAALLDESGWDGTTTSTIARRARVSVGSVYQFFPDRRALLQALALRSFTRFSSELEVALTDRLPRTWQAAVEVVVDAYVAFTRTEPGMRVLSFGGPVDERFLAPEQDNNAVVAARLGEVLRAVVPGLPDSDQLALVLRVAVEAADAVLDLAFRRDPQADPLLVGEAKALLTAYLGASGLLPG